MTDYKQTPIAIVGVGCRFPKADNVDEYWANIKNSLDAICEVPDSHWNINDYFDDDKNAPDMTYAKRGGFLNPVDFDPLEFGITPNNLEATDTTHLMGLIAARDALRDAGYASAIDKNDGRAFDRDRCSVVLGVTGTLELVIPLGARLGHPKWRKALKDAGVDNETAEDVVQRISNEYVPWQENSFPGLLGNVAAGRIANRFDLGGTNCVVDAACASSLSALHLATMELISGKSDMAISGGIDTFNDIFMYMCFSKTPALSPTGNSKPFSANGDGTILGEGVGVVVLKRLEDAQRDNDKIYGVIRGIGSSSDGLGNAIYAPSAKGQSKALKNAYAAANVDPKDVELVEAHGTGTKVGDRIELEALTSIYSNEETNKTWCAVGSVKSMIGHTKAAAGVASLIKAMLALKNKVLPPSIKVDQPLDIVKPGTAPHYVNTLKRPWVEHSEHPRFAALSALGFGGSNFHCVLEEAEATKTHIDWEPGIHLFAWSAANKNDLIAKIKSTAQEDVVDQRALAQATRKHFKNADQARCILVLDNESLDQRINELANGIQNNGSEWTDKKGAFYSENIIDGTLGILFPGQGSQRCYMLNDLACQFPELLDSLALVNHAHGSHAAQQRISDIIYPIPVFSDEERDQQSIALRQTDKTQPALAAVDFGAWKIFERFQVQAAAFAGHSFGELVALAAAGVYDEATLHKLACKRGALMASGDGDRGTMIAVSAPIAEIDAIISESGLDVIVANRNAPQQGIVSGTTTAIAQAEAVFKEKRIACKRLPVAAAFHSTCVADSEAPFLEFLNKQKFSKAHTDVYANKTAKTYAKSGKKIKETLASQLVSPVQFIEEIEHMYADGIHCFVELGPGNVLSNLVKSILGDRPHKVITLDSSKGKRHGSYDLALCLAELAQHGFSIDLNQWDYGYESTAQAPGKMSIKISGANYRSSYKDIPKRAPKPSAPVASPSTTQAPAAQPTPTAPNSNPAQNNALLQATQESINALQRMQEQTALLHQQYLASQETAQQSITQLLIQQQQLFNGHSITAVNMPDAQVPAPMPAQPIHQAPIQTAPVATTEAPAPKQESTNDADALAQALLSIVTDKTGYPDNMLDLGMHLDADLGIDSIKRVEILSALQDAFPALPHIEADTVSSFQTLQDIVNACAGQLTTSSSHTTTAPTTHATTSSIAPDLLEIVSEKTGYPGEMLHLEMHLDADLGIDSIKRVEILSALQERFPHLPHIEAEDMGSLQTLSDIVTHVDGHNAAVTNSAPIAAQHNNANISSSLLSIVADKTGYPLEMLSLEMQLDADLGIDSIKRVEILSALQEQDPQLPTIDAEQLSSIHSLQDIVKACASVATQAITVATPSATPAKSDLQQQLLNIVAEKTGYPLEMLDVSMHLDADLGIDSIKRVEILSALQELDPSLPSIEADQMGSIQQLKDIIELLGTHTSSNAPNTNSSNHDSTALTGTLLSIVAEKTGYPLEMLDITMQLDADLGIDSIKRVEILSALQEQIPDAPVVQADDIGNIQTLKDIIDHICSLESTQEQATNTSKVSITKRNDGLTPSVKRQPLMLEPCDDIRKSIALHNAHNCVILDDGSGLAQGLQAALECNTTILAADDEIDASSNPYLLIIIAHNEDQEETLLKRFAQFQQLLPPLSDNHGHLRCISHIGGLFGLKGKAVKPLNAAWGGIIKTADREFDNIHSKIIDWEQDLSIEALRDELLIDGPIEVALTKDGAFTCAIPETHIDNIKTAPLQKGDHLVISGGARGVTAEVARAIAERFSCDISLIGRSPLPKDEAYYLHAAHTEADIKQALIKHWDSGTPTPKAVNEACARVLAAREIHSTLKDIRASGVAVHYHSCDIRDRDAVTACIASIRSSTGRIDGLIHGAGVLADKHIVDKTAEQFSKVWSTKVIGAYNLLDACAEDQLKCLVMFSSSTARFGRIGQCDYAAANEVLNKRAQQYKAEHPHCKTLSINWGPWDGGMVTPELKQLFKSEGVEVIDCHAGAHYLCDELSHQGDACEIVLLGDYINQSDVPLQKQACTRLVFERDLNADNHPFLKSHVMNHKAVLPMAIIVEWLAHAATHENPGVHFLGMDQLVVYKGVITAAEATIKLSFFVSDTDWNDGKAQCTVEMRNGNTLHASALVLLGDSYATASLSTEAMPQGPAMSGNPYQDNRLFHGPDLQGLISVQHCDASGIDCLSQQAPEPKQWIEQPLKNAWYAEPMALDVAFQAMIIWSHSQWNAPSLPTRFERYEQYVDRFPAGPYRIIGRVQLQQKHKAISNIEFISERGDLIARILGYECIIDASLSASFSKNNLDEVNAS